MAQRLPDPRPGIFNTGDDRVRILDFERRHEEGLFYVGETIADLARQIEIEPSVLAATIKRYNGFVDKASRRFGRRHLVHHFGELRPIEGLRSTLIRRPRSCSAPIAGCESIPEARVLDHGTTHPGLYAAGEVTGGFHGAAYMTGSALGKALVFGRLAPLGRWPADEPSPPRRGARPQMAVDPATGRLPQRSPDRLVMSPFDEAALETALAVRDLGARTMIRAIVMGGREAEKIARAVAAFNVPVATLEIADWWDQMCVADALAGAFGDSDLVFSGASSGTVMMERFRPCLRRGWPSFVRSRPGGSRRALHARIRRREEWLTPESPVVVSVTNDRRNRLRKPLMKNVMMARQAGIETLPPFERKSCAQLAAVRSLAGSRSAVECELVERFPRTAGGAPGEMLA